MKKILMLMFLSMLFSVAIAAERPEPLSWGTDGLTAAIDLPVERFAAIDPEAMRARDADIGKHGEALQFAEPYTSHAGIGNGGIWETLANGDLIWRMRFDIPGATDINFGFQQFQLPEGATVHIYDTKHSFFQGPWSAAHNKLHGEFWTPVVPGDSAVIELFLPAGTTAELELIQVAGGYRDLFGHAGGPHLRNHGSCNNDVVCPEGDGWRDQIRSVATYSRGGSRLCTGQMVNDVPNSLTPYFLTADHCGMTSGNASSMVVYWNFEAPVCGQQDGGSLADNQTGATLRASRSDVDMSLLELDNQPDQSWAVFYSGWDRSDTQPGGAVGIHHPRTHVKSISFALSDLGTTASCIGGSTPNTHWHVPFWDDGTTEPGSSGSGLWNPQNGRLIGFLSGGLASCSVIDYDCYGKFSVAWDGASAASRLSDWLDPTGVNPDGIDGTDQDSFNIVPETTSISQCGFADLGIGIDITQAGTFNDPVTLSTNGLPVGVTSDFLTNPVTPPGNTQLTLGDLNQAGIGTFAFAVEGSGGGLDRSSGISVTINDAAPDTISVTSPSDGALGVSATPIIEWTAASQAFVYELEIALDAGFTNVVYSTTESSTSHEIESALNTNTDYYLRVRASNDCGTADWSATISFTTEALPGDCPVGTDAISLLEENFNGADVPTGWSTAGSTGTTTWAMSSAQTHSGSHSAFAQNIASVTDQRLASPAVTLPTDAIALFLTFQNWQSVESSSGGCYDGGLLEISINDGATWDQVTTSAIQVRDHDGAISTGFSNPLGGSQAWCGDPREFWERYSVDLSNWAGEDVRFRWRFGTDSSVSRYGWHVDSVQVKACAQSQSPLIFEDRFESSTP